MALRTVIFRNMDTGAQLTMPVTPDSFDVEDGRSVETLDMASFGQVNVPGLRTLFNKDQSFLLPARPAPYAHSWQSPYAIVNTLIAWSQAANVVRYMVYGTNVNVPCLIQTVRYREQDGTNDVYLTLTLKKYRYLSAETVVQTGGNKQREDSDQVAALDISSGNAGEKSYTVASGDCLISIAEKYYGDYSMAYKLATYNGIKNPNLIYTGDTLKLPPADTLAALSPTYGPAPTVPSVDIGNDIYSKVKSVAEDWRKNNL